MTGARSILRTGIRIGGGCSKVGSPSPWKVRENMPTRRFSASGGNVREVTQKAATSHAQDATRGISTISYRNENPLYWSAHCQRIIAYCRSLSRQRLDTRPDPHAPNRPGPSARPGSSLPNGICHSGIGKTFLRHSSRYRTSPVLVVTARFADEYVWTEVLSLGGHDVLAKPFQAAEVQWVLESAWRIGANRNQGAESASEAA